MSNNKIFRLVAALIIIVLAVMLIKNLTHKEPTPPTVTPPVTAMVVINEDGFAPTTVKVKVGTVVIWTNNDSKPHRIAANPFGSHSTLPSLDSKTKISPNGGTYRYTFDKAGTYGYHDELNPKINGTVIVK